MHRQMHRQMQHHHHRFLTIGLVLILLAMSGGLAVYSQEKGDSPSSTIPQATQTVQIYLAVISGNSGGGSGGSATATPTRTPTSSPTATRTATQTATQTATPTRTSTTSPTSTASPTTTATDTATATATTPPTATATATGTPTPTSGALVYSNGTCPTFSAGMNTFQSGSENRSFRLDLAGNPNGAPVIFGFHGFGGDPGQALDDTGLGSAVDTIRVGPTDRGVAPYDWHFTDISPIGNPDLLLFDDILACLHAQYSVDLDRIWATGHSAGGIFASYLAMHRSNRLAAVAVLSGGLGDPSTAPAGYITPTHDVPVLLTWGGVTDTYTQGGANFVYNNGDPEVFSFHVSNQIFSQNLQNDGHFVVECVGDFGHAIPNDAFSFLWPFLRDHPKGVNPKPYAGGNFPSDLNPLCKLPAQVVAAEVACQVLFAQETFIDQQELSAQIVQVDGVFGNDGLWQTTGQQVRASFPSSEVGGSQSPHDLALGSGTFSLPIQGQTESVIREISGGSSRQSAPAAGLIYAFAQEGDRVWPVSFVTQQPGSYLTRLYEQRLGTNESQILYENVEWDTPAVAVQRYGNDICFDGAGLRCIQPNGDSYSPVLPDGLAAIDFEIVGSTLWVMDFLNGLYSCAIDSSSSQLAVTGCTHFLSSIGNNQRVCAYLLEAERLADGSDLLVAYDECESAGRAFVYHSSSATPLASFVIDGGQGQYSGQPVKGMDLVCS